MARLASRMVGLSSLWRNLSPRNPSHQLILGACSVAFLAVLAIRMTGGQDLAGSAVAALNVAVVIFLAWAIGREIDPDSPDSALLGAAAAGLILLAGSAHAGVMVAVLIAVRIVVRSTGVAPTLLDLAALPALAAVVAWAPRGWIGGAVLAAALVWDAVLPRPGRRLAYGAAVATLAAALAVAIARDTVAPGFEAPDLLEWVVAGGGTLAFAAMRRYSPRSVQDRTKSKIDPERLQGARLLALAAGVGAFVCFGGPSVPLMASLWGAVLGVALYDRLAKRPGGIK